MKRNVTQKLMASMAMMSFVFSGYGQDIDLVPGISYSYNPANAQGIIEIVEIDVCNNGWDNAGPFDVTIYLYDQSTTDVYFIGTTRLTSGLSGSMCTTISDWSININDTPGVPAGTYRVGIYVDSNEEISETNETNNAGLLSGNNNYTPSGSTASIDEYINISGLNLFPNPANDIINITFNTLTASDVELYITSLEGKIVKHLDKRNQLNGSFYESYSISDLPGGIYLLTISTNDKQLVNKIIIGR